MKKFKEQRIDNTRALLITNCVVRDYIFWKRESLKFPESQKIRSVLVWYSNLLHLLPTTYHGWKAFFRQIRFDLRFLDGLNSEVEKYLLDVIKNLYSHLEALLWLPSHYTKLWK